MSVEPIAISAVPNAHTAVSSFAAVSGSETPSRSTKTSFEEGSTARVWSATVRRPRCILASWPASPARRARSVSASAANPRAYRLSEGGAIAGSVRVERAGAGGGAQEPPAAPAAVSDGAGSSRT